MTGFEPLPLLVDAATKSVAGIVIKSLLERTGGFLGGISKGLDEKRKQLIFNASKRYVENYSERHGILKVLGMRDHVKLESLYTAVQFLDESDIRSFESIEKLEEVYRQAKSRGFRDRDCSKKEGIKVANDKQYLMVLGGPGAGKSTFLRKMGLEALKGNKKVFKHESIPVFIELKRFTATEIEIEKAIAEEFSICGFPEPEKSTAKLLEQGKLLILLDGLDEVPTKNVNEAISKIQNFVDKYDKNRFIASCRIAAYRSGFRRFSDVAMADFDDDQIQQFIRNWFQSEADKKVKTAEKCWELLQKPENQAAKELAHTPLLLTFLCLVYDRSQNFPDNRSVLYRNALRILLEEWAAEKRILRDEIYQGLHTELEEILLSQIAYTGFDADRLFFSQRDIVQEIKTFLAGNLNAPQHLDGEAVLNAIAVQQGILVERAEDVFSFSHLTLQEYLTAQYIDDHRQIEQLVLNHLTDERWKEVFLLVAGLMRGGADELLLLMEKEAQNYINSPKLQGLLRWAEEATTGSQGDLKPVAKRAIANANANAIAIANANANAYAYANANANANAIAYANAIANAYANANAIANAIAIANANAIANAIAIANANANAIAIANANAIANAIAIANANANANAIAKFIEVAQELEKINIFKNVNFPALIARLQALKARIPDDEQPQEVRQAFVKRLMEIWLNAFNLTQDIVNLSKEEIEAYERYFYANYLILQCKQSAVRVSPITWEGIEDRMLLVPGD